MPKVKNPIADGVLKIHLHSCWLQPESHSLCDILSGQDTMFFSGKINR